MAEKPFAPSGRQFGIARGGLRAVAVEVGGGLRVFEAAGRPVLEPYAPEAMCDGAHGAILAPWPNRVRDGRYRFDADEHQLDLSEPERQNAIHGLVRWRPWTPLLHEAECVVLGCRLPPSPGYPFALSLRVEYRLDADGLTTTITAENVGTSVLPYALGQHPYLAAGEGGVEGARLRLEARTRLLADAERRVPVGRAGTAGTPFDFGAGPRIGSMRVDDAFADLARDAGGRARVRLERADGGAAELWLDATFPYVQVYTGDDLAPARRRHAVAVEPMTAPANALRSGEGLVRLEPGGRHEARWGVTPL
jgi:aldose 1-epimerase